MNKENEGNNMPEFEVMTDALGNQIRRNDIIFYLDDHYQIKEGEVVFVDGNLEYANVEPIHNPDEEYTVYSYEILKGSIQEAMTVLKYLAS